MLDKDLFLYDLAVTAILKCEGPYLKEWLDYHLLAGVDHFYLYDNDSPDNQAEVAKPYVEAGLVTYIPFPGKKMQFPAYIDAQKRFKFQCRYMAFIDGDEFILPKSNRSIVEVVDEILSRDDKAAGLAIHWNAFGSNGHETADYSRGVLERFTRCSPKDIDFNRWIKNVADPRKIKFFNSPHVMNYFEGFYSVDENLNVVHSHIPPVTFNKIVINHYHCKSWEEYSSKNKRGDAVYGTLNFTRSKFDSHNNNENKDFNDGILKYRDERAKVYQPPKARSVEDLIKALERNLSTNSYAGKMETFLTCRAVAAYLNEKTYEEMSLKAIIKALESSPSVADKQMFDKELPELLNLPYPIVEKFHKL